MNFPTCRTCISFLSKQDNPNLFAPRCDFLDAYIPTEFKFFCSEHETKDGTKFVKMEKETLSLLEAAKDACLMLEEISNVLKVISKKIPDIKDSERFLKIMDAIKKAEAK